MVEDMSDRLARLKTEWHPSKNGELTPDKVTKGSSKKVWWLCPKGHEYQAQIRSRTKENGTNCPFCSNKKANKGNCLTATYPEVAKQWHPKKMEV